MLRSDSPCINKGGMIADGLFRPEWEYIKHRKKQERKLDTEMDLGAYEYVDPTGMEDIINKEIIVSFYNGVLFALIAGFFGWFWFDNFSLGVVLALAMILNIVIAGLSGILIPIGLNKLGIDPAIASTVFLTTITDVVGFFSFLGLAALFLV